jgi:YD repeat-containing protein
MHGYDGASQRIRSVNPLGKIITTVYDAAGQSVATIYANGNRTTQAYDAASRIALVDARCR